jgi:riboflavin kinase/FMN adenylyltransferase
MPVLKADELLRSGPNGRTVRAIAGPVALTLGSFDGVHLGHQALVRHVAGVARARGWASVVVTFWPHPVKVLRPEVPLRLLCTLEERTRRLLDCSADYVVVWPFTPELSRLPGRAFLELLRTALDLRYIVVGPTFHMGHRRDTDAARLRELGQELGFTVEIISPLEVAGDRVSSTRIREVLAQGNVWLAAQLLGRPYAVSGTVVHGDHRGRLLGVPTANLRIPEKLVVPKNGIYATLVEILDDQGDAPAGPYPAATNVGDNPTFPNQYRRIESHLLDYDGDLYGRPLRVHFIERLRDEVRFESVEALVAQMQRDLQQAREILARLDYHGPPRCRPRPDQK